MMRPMVMSAITLEDTNSGAQAHVWVSVRLPYSLPPSATADRAADDRRARGDAELDLFAQ